MKRKILLIFSTIVIFACLLALSVSAISGTGIETDPYVIETAEDFVSIKDKLSAYYKLDADISVSSTTGATIYGRKNVGGIAGVVFYTGSVTNCANYGAISGKSISKGVDMGGIVGCTWYTETSYVTIKNCYNEGTVEGEGYNCGGVVGYSYAGKIVNCFNVAQVTSTASNGAGSIIGKTEPNKTHSLSGYISLTSDALIGDKNGTVTIGSTLLESAGVAIYLGSGSGIRGEFHVDNSGYEAFCRFAGIDKADFEYGSIVSTKEIVASLNGDLFSEKALASGKVAIAPAIKNGEKQYFYVDENKGEGYCKEYQEYICVDATGKIIKPTYVSEHFGVILRQHQLPKIRFHDLRHSCASLLLSNGVPMKMIQDWLGHSDMGTTVNI